MDTRTHSSHGGEATAGEAHPGPADASDDTNDHAGHEAHGAGEGAAGQGGHGQHGGHGDHVAMFRRRFWWSLVLSLPVVVTAHMIQDWFGYHLDFPGDGLIGPALGTVIFLYGGWPFLTGGLGEARGRQPGMMLLIAMAITVAFGASAATSLGLFDLDFWWELAALISMMLLGHWQEMKALGQAQDALAALAALLPDEAERVGEDGATAQVALAALRTGDVVLVRAGGRVPADGHIVDGAAALDEAMIKGGVTAGAEGRGRPGRRRHRVHRLLHPGAGRRGGRRHRARRDPAARGPGPGVEVRGPGARRPGCRRPVLRGHGGRRRHAARVAGRR